GKNDPEARARAAGMDSSWPLSIAQKTSGCPQRWVPEKYSRISSFGEHTQAPNFPARQNRCNRLGTSASGLPLPNKDCADRRLCFRTRARMADGFSLPNEEPATTLDSCSRRRE